MTDTSSCAEPAYQPPAFSIEQVLEALTGPDAGTLYQGGETATASRARTQFLATATTVDIEARRVQAQEQLDQALVPRGLVGRLRQGAEILSDGAMPVFVVLALVLAFPVLLARVAAAHLPADLLQDAGARFVVGVPVGVILGALALFALSVLVMMVGMLPESASVRQAKSEIRMLEDHRLPEDVALTYQRWCGRAQAWHLHVKDSLQRPLTCADREILWRLSALDGADPAFREFLDQVTAHEPASDTKELIPASARAYHEWLATGGEPELLEQTRRMRPQQEQGKSRGRALRAPYSALFFLGGLGFGLALIAAGYCAWSLQPLPQWVWGVLVAMASCPVLVMIVESLAIPVASREQLAQEELDRALTPLGSQDALELANALAVSPSVRRWVAHARHVSARNLRQGDLMVALELLRQERALRV